MIRTIVRQNGKPSRRWMPADALIYPLIYHLNQHGFGPAGWDQGTPNSKERAFIYLSVGKSRSTSTYPKLMQKVKQHFKTIPEITIEPDFDEGVNIEFDPRDIPRIFKRLGLRPSTKVVLPGSNALRKYKRWTFAKMNAYNAKLPNPQLD